MTNIAKTYKSAALYLLARRMIENRIRGGWRLMALLERLGYFDDRVVRYEVAKGYRVFVPIHRPERWTENDVRHYESALIAEIVRHLHSADGRFTLIDCGADIGLVSTLICARSGKVERLYAFEPSEEAFPVLQATLAGLPLEARAMKMAVSDFKGRGILSTPSYDASHHARYLAPSTSGDIEVTKIDTLNLPRGGSLVVKIDVEGGELGVIGGAEATLKSACHVVVALEAHPAVFQRTGIDPASCLRLLQSIRPFKFTISELADQRIDVERPFFEQLGEGRQRTCNVICVSI